MGCRIKPPDEGRKGETSENRPDASPLVPKPGSGSQGFSGDTGSVPNAALLFRTSRWLMTVMAYENTPKRYLTIRAFGQALSDRPKRCTAAAISQRVRHPRRLRPKGFPSVRPRPAANWG